MTRHLELDDLYAFELPSDPRVSPDGSTIAFVVTQADRGDDSDHSSIWAVPAPGGEPRRLTQGTSDSSPRWSPDGRSLAFLSARSDSPPQIYVLPVDGGEARRLTDLALGAGEPVWSPDGSRIAFIAAVDTTESDAASPPLVITRLGHKADGAGRLGGLRQHLFVIDAEGSEARQITFGDFFASAPVWAPDGSALVFSASMTEDHDVTYASAIYRVAAVGGRPGLISPDDGAFAAVGWSSDGSRLLVVGAEKVRVGHTNLYTLDLSGGTPQRLAADLDRNVMIGAPGYPGAFPRFADNDSRILFCIRERGRVHVLSVPASGGDTTVLVGDDRIVGGMSEANGTIAFVAATASSPGEVYALGSDGTETQLTSFFADGLPDVELIRPKERWFTAPDGTRIEGWVLREDGTQNAPLLLDIHGGPHNAWGPVFDPVHLYHQRLASRGWTIAYINPRGSDGYGEEFWSALVEGGWGHSDTQDFIAAVDELVADGTADPQRIAVTGYSYGGEMTCWLTARTDRFATAVAGGCVSDLVSLSGTSDVGWYIRAIEFERPDFADRSLIELSPITYVTDVTAPTLMLHGGNDDRCPPGQAELWFTALRSRGIPTELVLYPGGSHIFILSGKPSHRLDYSRRVEEWVTRYVDAQDATPAIPLSQRLRGLQARFEKAVERHGVVGASLAVLSGDDLFEAAAGVVNVETSIPVTSDSVFQIGSITKSYTATLAMQLVDEGLLDLDTPIVTYLPEFKVADPEVTKQVTLRHLLSHSSGIQGDHFEDTGRGDDCLERYVASCASLGQNHPLGATMSYCNAGYVVLGRVIEKLTGTTWDEALRTRLLEPLGLDHTVTLPEEAIRFRAAFGHDTSGERPELVPAWVLPRSSGPAGLITSTAADVVGFARMHLDDGRSRDGKQVLSPASVKAMQQEQIAIPDPYTLGTHWGLGFILFDWDGRRLFGHDGNTIGQSAYLRIFPEHDLAIALLTNGGNSQDLFREIYGDLARDLAGIEMPPRPQPLPEQPALDLERYVGTYERVSYRLEIEERDGKLVGTSTYTGSLAELVPETTEEHLLEAAGPDIFVYRDEGAETWTPLVFFDLADGRRAIHSGARATPRVART